MASVSTLVKLPLEKQLLDEIVEDAKDYAFCRGSVFKMKETLPYEYSVTFVPFALFPSPWPKQQYQMLSDLQNDMNLVYWRASNDYEFLRQSLEKTILADEWTRKLWNIYERTRQSQKNIPSLAILRSDYMIGHDGQSKQIEVNTVSSGFGGVSPVIRDLQSHILAKLQLEQSDENHPVNNGRRTAAGLAEAWKLYGNSEAVICFAVEDVVYNTYDQRQLSLELVETYKVPQHKIIRRTNADFCKAVLEDGKLLIGNHEIAVVYIRTWYDPWQLPTEETWRMRELVESSKAIKCPNIAWHLTGCKKIQQELARDGILEKFCDDAAQAQRVRKVFAGLYALEEEQHYKEVVAHPENFVLKPQREGGGNNIFGADIPNFLKTLPADQRREFIAMEMIKPISSKNYLINKGDVRLTDVASELGILGYVLADTVKLHVNDSDCGYIYRAKDVSSNEGGISAGFGHLDSPFLF